MVIVRPNREDPGQQRQTEGRDPWEPRVAPPTIFGDPERYRNLVNLWGGNAVAFALLAIGWIGYGPVSVHSMDGLTKWEAVRYGVAFGIASLLIEIVLAVPWIAVGKSSRVVVIRNPLTVARVPVSRVLRVSSDSAFFPVLQTRGGEHVRIIALQQSTLHYGRGGSEELVRLRDHLEFLSGGRPDVGEQWAGQTDVHKRLSSPTWPTTLLFAGWVAWAIATILF